MITQTSVVEKNVPSKLLQLGSSRQFSNGSVIANLILQPSKVLHQSHTISNMTISQTLNLNIIFDSLHQCDWRDFLIASILWDHRGKCITRSNTDPNFASRIIDQLFEGFKNFAIIFDDNGNLVVLEVLQGFLVDLRGIHEDIQFIHRYDCIREKHWVKVDVASSQIEEIWKILD